MELCLALRSIQELRDLHAKGGIAISTLNPDTDGAHVREGAGSKLVVLKRMALLPSASD